MITFFSNLIRNPMESACPYLEGETDSYQLATSHLVSLEETLIEFPSFLGQRKGLWFYLFIERDTNITLSLESHCLCSFV